MLQGILVGSAAIASAVATVVDKCLIATPLSAFAKALKDGRAWLWASLTYDPDAVDTILALRNESERTLWLKRFWFSSDTASQIQLWAANLDAVTMAGTAVPGVQCRRELAGGVAPATAFCDETGNGEAALLYPGLIERRVVGVNGLYSLELEGKIALPRRHAIGVDLTTAATAANAAILGYFE